MWAVAGERPGIEPESRDGSRARLPRQATLCSLGFALATCPARLHACEHAQSRAPTRRSQALPTARRRVPRRRERSASCCGVCVSGRACRVACATQTRSRSKQRWRWMVPTRRFSSQRCGGGKKKHSNALAPHTPEVSACQNCRAILTHAHCHSARNILNSSFVSISPAITADAQRTPHNSTGRRPHNDAGALCSHVVARRCLQRARRSDCVCAG